MSEKPRGPEADETGEGPSLESSVKLLAAYAEAYVFYRDILKENLLPRLYRLLYAGLDASAIPTPLLVDLLRIRALLDHNVCDTYNPNRFREFVSGQVARELKARVSADLVNKVKSLYGIEINAGDITWAAVNGTSGTQLLLNISGANTNRNLERLLAQISGIVEADLRVDKIFIRVDVSQFQFES